MRLDVLSKSAQIWHLRGGILSGRFEPFFIHFESLKSVCLIAMRKRRDVRETERLFMNSNQFGIGGGHRNEIE